MISLLNQDNLASTLENINALGSNAELVRQTEQTLDHRHSLAAKSIRTPEANSRTASLRWIAWLVCAGMLGTAPSWGCVPASQLNCLVLPELKSAGAAANADSVRKTAGADDGLRQAFERATYSFEDSGHGTFHGANPAQQLTLEFNGQEARLNHPAGSVSFHLTGYGYGDRLLKPPSAHLTGKDNRLEYQRGGLTEWYLNETRGLEQGFTLAKQPGTRREGEPLVIALGVTGGLLPAQTADEGSVRFGGVLRYAGLKALDARGRVLASRMEVRDREVRLIVEDRDAQYPLVVDPLWTQQQELTASDGAALDYFGRSVSVSGDTAVIGAHYSENGYQGVAYVFVRSGGIWSQQQKLTASDGGVNDQFGVSVSVSGDTTVIGANGGNSGQGAAYVFVRSGGVWSQQQKLTASDGAANDHFGFPVSVNGDTVVIGATGKNGAEGAAYVFVRGGGVWSQQQELTASDGARNDEFGYSVSVSGDTAVIGAYGKNGGQGAAYVFVRGGGVWSQQEELTASDGAANTHFGYSVSASADTAVIGAYGKNGYQGAAYVFVRASGVWSQQQELTASDGAANDYFGISVSVSADTAVIGAYVKNSAQGAAYVFVRTGGVWSQQQKLAAADGAANDWYGISVALSGDTAVIGAPGKTIGANSLQGAAYVYVRPRLGTDSLLVGSAGGTSSVVLSYDASWTATANDSFLHLSAGSGTGSGVVVFTYDPFSGTGTRTGTLTIAGLTLTVTQAGVDYVGVSALTTITAPGLISQGGLAVDMSGNLFMADGGNTIKEWVAATQQVTTVTSSGLRIPIEVAPDGSGNVYIADLGNGAVKEWDAATQQVTTLLSSTVFGPYGLAVDGSGNLYISGWGNAAGNATLEEWNPSTGQVTTLPSSSLFYPWGVAVDAAGNVYVADQTLSAIAKWSPSTQQMTTLGSGLFGPHGVAVDGSGDVYIADTFNNAIKEWNAATQQLITLVSSGLETPQRVAVDGFDNIYIADTFHNSLVIKEIPHVFVGPAGGLTEPPSSGSDSLLPVLPATASLTGVFAPTSDQSWLTIGTITNGVINFSFTANTTASSRTAHITVLGQQIAVTQAANSAPTATSVNITGTARVGQQLTGHYNYSDVDGDAEGTSTFRWLRDSAPISGATASTYTVVLADLNHSIVFEVTPVAATGTSPGAAASSGSVTISNTPPSVTPVGVTRPQGTSGSALIATVSDIEDAPGSLAITVQSDNPSNGVTLSGLSNNGGNVTANVAVAANASTATFALRATDSLGASGTGILTVTVTANSAPTATGVNITGTPNVGQVLAGSYTYSDAEGDLEGTSTFRWLRDGAPISGATGNAYVVVAADSGHSIQFEVTPVAATGTSPGTAVQSSGATILNSAPTSSLQFAYAADGNGGVLAYMIDGATGALTALSGSPFQTAGFEALSVAADLTGKFAYVANGPVSNNVSAYTIDAGTGTLTAIPGSPFVAGPDPNFVAVDPTGKFVYVVNRDDGTVSVYTVNTSTGALTAISGSPFSVGPNPRPGAIDPTGKFFYVPDNDRNSVFSYTIDPSTGALTAISGSPFTAGSRPQSMTVDPMGKFAYVANYFGNSVSGLQINASTGALTPISGSPFSVGTGPRSIAVDPSGRFAYVANSDDGSVSAYTIDASSGALTPIRRLALPCDAPHQSCPQWTAQESSSTWRVAVKQSRSTRSTPALGR